MTDCDYCNREIPDDREGDYETQVNVSDSIVREFNYCSKGCKEMSNESTKVRL